MLRSVYMKKIYLFIATLFISNFTLAANETVGLGAIIGDPTGLSMKFKISPINSIDAAVAWSSEGVHFHSNYLWQHENYLNLNRQSFDLYYGFGGRIISISSGKNKDKTSVGPRTPLGINYKLKNTKLQFFAEAALNLNLTPNSEVDLDAGIGMRFHF